ncbi:MAG: helix-turn-helix transcriptional regulator [Lachnospiraceae bacterium]|nr:helix-turn-helix transcriptional regulator [Lachnospiraceae bacterium]
MKNLRMLRTEAGISQQALGDRFNVSQQAIYKYENGLAEPDIEMLKNFAKFFNVSIDFLLSYTPPQNENSDKAALRLTSLEIELIKEIRKLPLETQEELLRFLKKL